MYFGEWLHGTARKAENNKKTDSKIIQGDQEVSVHLMITTQKVTSNVQSVPRQFPGPGGH
jgi:hypothetical protein